MACIAMIGAGAAVGSFMGGNTNAAREPDTVQAASATRIAIPIDAKPVVATAASISGTTAVADRTGAVAETRVAESIYVKRVTAPAPAAVIAMRFPAQWHNLASTGRRSPNTNQALAYAPEPARNVAPTEKTAERSGYQLASVDPAPPKLRKRATQRAAPKIPTLFNDAQLASIKKRLRLTPDQEQYWPPVAAALRAIGWRHARQSNPRRPVRSNRPLAIDPNSPEVAQLKSAAFPLIMSLTAEQKREVRELAHTMGLSKVVAQI